MENIEEILQWAEEYLLSHGYTINEPPNTIQTTPWSNVMRFSTSKGHIFLKQTPRLLALEPAITQILYDQFHASVPLVIETNKKLNCFLMNNAGNPLREFFKKNFQPDLLSKAIKQYMYIQYSTAEHLNTFLELGGPDWRLDKLSTLYAQLTTEEDLLINDGMTKDELSLFSKSQSKFSSMCELLSRYKIPETLDHCDFHDNNILIEENTYKMTIIDLGETVITHPFFSLISCLRNAFFRYSLKENDKIYCDLKNTVLEKWIEFKSKNKLLEAFSLAEKLWPIYAAFGEDRLRTSSNPKKLQAMDRRGRIAMGLKEFIKY